jgi:small subunit ribosomal protein S7
MGRRKEAPKRELFPDPQFNSPVVAKFVSRMMLDGKRSTSRKIIYTSMGILKEKTGNEPLEVFLKALGNVKPEVEVKSRRVGGSTYQVPVDVSPKRQEALAMRWLIHAARSRSGKSMADKLSAELLDAYNSTGTAFKKKEDTHRMADANKAFSHYRW